MRETWRHLSHSTVKEPRSTSGLSDVARTLSDSGRALEYKARLPTGSAVGDVASGSVDSSPALVAVGTQNSARLPRGSAVLSPSPWTTAYIASIAANTCDARVR
jgi:hypothetical protein